MGDHVLDDLEWRGLIALSTDFDALRVEMSAGPVTVYCGFDPTAPSLHMGNLLQILTLRRLQEAGHRPIGIVGGATGMIGDPKEDGERRLNSLETVQAWSDTLREQVSRFWSFDGDNAATVVNNYDWTGSLSTVEFLRDIGKHFPVNRMLGREVVRSDSRRVSRSPSSATSCFRRWTTSSSSDATGAGFRLVAAISGATSPPASS